MINQPIKYLIVIALFYTSGCLKVVISDELNDMTMSVNDGERQIDESTDLSMTTDSTISLEPDVGLEPDSGSDGPFVGPNEIYHLKNSFSGDSKCLEANDPTVNFFGGNAFMANCGTFTGQSWRFIPIEIMGNTYYHMKTVGSDEVCLEGNDQSSTQLNGASFMAECGPFSGMLWNLEEEDTGWYKLTNESENGCLNGNDPDNGEAAFMTPCEEESTGIRWLLISL